MNHIMIVEGQKDYSKRQLIKKIKKINKPT